MEDDISIADTGREDYHAHTANLTPSGSGAQPTRATLAGTTITCTTTAGVTLHTGVTRLRFGTPEPPTIPIRVHGGILSDKINTIDHQNMFAPLRQQGSESGEQISHAFSSGILRGGSASAASSSRGRRDRDPIPLTPEILLLMNHLEPDKGKQARLLTELLIGHRTLPCIEQELQILLDRKAIREIKR